MELNELIDEKIKLVEVKDKLHINENIQKDDNKDDIQLIEGKNIIQKKIKKDNYDEPNDSKIYNSKSINYKQKKKDGYLKFNLLINPKIMIIVLQKRILIFLKKAKI